MDHHHGGGAKMPPEMAVTSAAHHVADSKISPGDDYEEIREQVRSLLLTCLCCNRMQIAQR